MLIFRPVLLLGTLAVAIAVHGQTAPATSTPQTGSTAPASTSPAATAAQAAEVSAARDSATHGSRAAMQSKGQGSARRHSARSANQGTPAQNDAGNQPGITGVPGYGPGAPRGTAPNATADVVITGTNDGSKPGQTAGLPGITAIHNAFGIAKGTPIHVRLQQPVDSGHARNGDTVRGVLSAPVGGVPAGAPVQLTVVAVAAAGQMSSNGELSLQVVSVNGERVLSEVVTAEGKEGAKIMPDDAPARGTEAIFTPDQPLTLPAG
jgi:hypothetical protein